MNKEVSLIKIRWIRIVYLVIIALFVIFLIKEIPSLKGSFKEVRLSKINNYLIILLFVVLSFFMASLSYLSLSLKRLKLFRTLIMQFASNTLNKLLPAGIGAMGANYLYLKKNNLSTISSATTVAINNFLGVVASLFLLLLIFITTKNLVFRFSNLDISIIIILLIVVFIVSFIILSIKSIKLKFIKFLKSFLNQLLLYRKHKLRLFMAFLAQLALAFFNILSLYLSMRSVNGSLDIFDIMIIYSVAIWFGSLIPSPGGFGSVDVGLVGAFVAYGTSLPLALGAVLVFRLLNFWTPLIIGIPSLIYVRAKKYI